jgi:hypothetical protein
MNRFLKGGMNSIYKGCPNLGIIMSRWNPIIVLSNLSYLFFGCTTFPPLNCSKPKPRLLPDNREWHTIGKKNPNQKIESAAILSSAWDTTYILFKGVGDGALNPLNPPIFSLNLGYPKVGPIMSLKYPTKYFFIFQTLVEPFQ